MCLRSTGSKKGFITIDYKADFGKGDTVNDTTEIAYDDFILDVPQDSLFATKGSKRYIRFY
ncbi:hypothetical protein HP439_07410 [Sphingobacterium shayense]|uniref:hypothetical protein n=1 Tax=Sphingobacterium shayense TaxID=626343 RepID=UPI001557EB21|nr:hypothetical protein [Sphingobacterium shayense]NQD70543.1 hypothetical protein [Sphingobacterium shayense]